MKMRSPNVRTSSISRKAAPKAATSTTGSAQRPKPGRGGKGGRGGDAPPHQPPADQIQTEEFDVGNVGKVAEIFSGGRSPPPTRGRPPDPQERITRPCWT